MPELHKVLWILIHPYANHETFSIQNSYASSDQGPQNPVVPRGHGNQKKGQMACFGAAGTPEPSAEELIIAITVFKVTFRGDYAFSLQ